jgi:hypothetical protein
MVKGIRRRMTITLATLKSSIFPSFVAMYIILTKILKIIEEIMKIISIDLPKFIDLFILLTPFK